MLSTGSEQQGKNIRVRAVFLTVTKILDLLFYQVCKKTMSDCYFCLRYVLTRKEMEKCIETYIFPVHVNNGKDVRVTRRRFENSAFMAYTNFIMTSQNKFAAVRVIRDDVKFCVRLGILYAKSHSH